MSKSKSSMHPATEMLPLVSAGEPDAAPALAEHAAAIRALGKSVIGDVIEIGRWLTDAKVIAGHGRWLPWLEREFGWSEDTAERFMSLHRLQGQIPQVAEYDLPVSGLYLLAAPSTPPEARTEVIKRAADGEKVTVRDIKTKIAEAKGRQQPATRPAGPETLAPAYSEPERPKDINAETREHRLNAIARDIASLLDDTAPDLRRATLGMLQHILDGHESRLRGAG
jgi:hypothetical protein